VITPLAALLASGSTTTTTLAASSHKSSGSILDPIAKPIAWLLAQIYSVVPNYGVAILVLSVVWMLLISPLTLKSTRSMLAMQKLQPQLKRLQEQHKDDRQAFAQAQMDLFREHNVSPFGSCLPMLLPMPVFFALFRVIDSLSNKTKAGVPAPKYLSHSTRMYADIVHAGGHLNAFGMDLAKNALSGHSSALAAAPYWLLLLIMAGTSYMQSAQMMSRNPASQNNPQMRMMKYLPLVFVLFCIRFPAGVVLYYAMSNLCRIVQQDAMYRFDPKVKTLVAKEVSEVEEKTHEIEEQKKRGPGYTPPRSARPAPAGGAGSGSGSSGSGPSGPGPGPGAGSSGSASGGRSRFRDLLAAAAEQQRSQQQAKSGGAGGGQSPGRRAPAPPSRTGGGATDNGGATHGRASNGTGQNGAAGRSGLPQPGRPAKKSRNNRKRRGR
jgi:YidC/Oxa1 family membrane protein insertase